MLESLSVVGTMLDFCLTSPSSLPLGVSFQEQSFSRVPKDFLHVLQCNSPKQESLRPGQVLLKQRQIQDSWKLFWDHENPLELEETVQKSVIVAPQDGSTGSLLIDVGITEKLIGFEDSHHLIMPNEEAHKGGHHLLTKPDALHALGVDVCLTEVSIAKNMGIYELEDNGFQSPLVYPRGMTYGPTPCMVLFSETDHGTIISVHHEGKVLFTGARDQMQDILCLISEFNHSKRIICHGKQLLVPYFTRLDEFSVAPTFKYSTNQNMILDYPITSPEKVGRKSFPRKRTGRKLNQERELFNNSDLHACENLLTLLVGRHSDKTLISGLKKSSPMLARMLTNFSVGITGTGLAVMLFIFTKAVNGRLIFTPNRLLSMGFAFGLVWVSRAVSSLKDTIVSVSKSSAVKVTQRDVKNVNRMLKKDLNQIVFRAATVMAVVALRFA